MNFKNRFTFSIALILAIVVLTACQRHSKEVANDGSFQCISATIMIAGKPTTTVVEWNSKTGMARILDSMVVTSKATGAQNVVVGWIPLGDLQSAIQEIVARNQAVQQQPVAAQSAVSASNQEASAALAKKKK